MCQGKVQSRTEEVVEELVDAAEKLPMFNQAGLDNEMREKIVVICEEIYLHCMMQFDVYHYCSLLPLF